MGSDLSGSGTAGSLIGSDGRGGGPDLDQWSDLEDQGEGGP